MVALNYPVMALDSARGAEMRRQVEGVPRLKVIARVARRKIQKRVCKITPVVAVVAGPPRHGAN